MAYEQRIPIIQSIERLRSSRVFCYLTSLRQNVPAQISQDSVRVIADHLSALPNRPIDRLDLFLCSNGGDGTVPWRLVSLFREYAKSFCVLLPHRAYSAATLIALGADEIVMHPFAEMGPIDPTVANDFNPVEQNTNRRIGINVEDVKAYVQFVKSTVGITHEDELVKTIEILANKVHPLALGNVERFLSQSRLIATKILGTHMQDANKHQVSEIVETMASKLYFHGHPISRKEAKDELKLKVNLDLAPDLESAMWNLYLDYETEFNNRTPFNPAPDLLIEVDRQMKTVAAANAATAAAAPGAPGAPVPLPQAVQLPIEKTHELLHSVVESLELSSKFESSRRFSYLGQNQNAEPIIRELLLKESWNQSRPPAAPPRPARGQRA